MTRQLMIASLLVAASAPAFAQAPAGKPSAAEPQAAKPAGPTAPAPPAPPANYAYTRDDRRDPFVALLGSTGKKSTPGPGPVRVEGVAGMITDEIAVKGILQSQGNWVAMVSGPSGKVYTVHTGDKLADGTIRGISPQYVLIVQQVNDPLSLEKQREVKKFLRGGDNK